MNDYNFGNFVCELREQKGLTQADIASELGVTAAAVSKWENGSSKPRVEVLFRLAEILGVRPEELMAGKRLGETLDAEAVKRINERYEYLCKIESYNNKQTKTDRIFAWLIDWLRNPCNIHVYSALQTISRCMSHRKRHFFRLRGMHRIQLKILKNELSRVHFLVY